MYSKIYPRLLETYIYSLEYGFYFVFNPNEVKTLLMRLLTTIHPSLNNPKYLGILYHSILYGPNSETGLPLFNYTLFVFTNGTYELDKGVFRPWSPHDFVKYRVEYPYDPNAECPQIVNFLRQFCGHFDDRLHFTRCWFWALVHSFLENQIFLYVQGPGATGKSVFTHLASAIVGKNAVITTSLKVLNNDPFEVTNLADKKLISIVDSTFYKGDIAVLKMISENDSLMGRTKYLQGSFEVKIQGLVLIVSYFPLGSLDTSGAITRRMRLFPADSQIPEYRIGLFVDK
jgi:putative DNA primase/helicase